MTGAVVLLAGAAGGATTLAAGGAALLDSAGAALEPGRGGKASTSKSNVPPPVVPFPALLKLPLPPMLLRVRDDSRSTLLEALADTDRAAETGGT